MKDESSGDACRNGKDSAPAPVRKNTEGKDHQASQYRDFEKDRSHRLTVLGACRSSLSGLGMVAVPAVQVREQEHQR
jgi:hypothetical protein